MVKIGDMKTRKSHPGDTGRTRTLEGKIVLKNDPCIEVLGEIDELRSILGVIRSMIKVKETKKHILHFQNDLQKIMAEIAMKNSKIKRFTPLSDEDIHQLDEKIHFYEKQNEIPNEFVTPGDDISSALLDIGRTITRKVERRMVNAFQSGIINNPVILTYFNRLSTLLFFMEIYETRRAQV
jgi:cob(I)alamin adenosyltransferase